MPASLGNLIRLKKLNLCHCKRLKNLPDQLGDLQSLAELDLSGCTQLNTSNLHRIFGGLGSLKRLFLRECCNLFELPGNINRLLSLEYLSMSATSVQSLPTTIKYLSKLQSLYLEKCGRLRFVPELPRSIEKLSARDCSSLETIKFVSTEAMPSRSDWITFDFQNCLELQECCLKAIRASAMLKISRFVSARKEMKECRSSRIIYPGSRVPEWFMNRTTRAFITMDISSASHSMDWGFILCVIVPPSPFENIFIDCETNEDDGHTIKFIKTSSQSISSLTSDHVFIWYDEGLCSELRKRIQRSRTDEERTTYYSKISFKFKVCYPIYKDNEDYSDKLYDLEIKECGVCPTYTSEYKDFMKQIELELQSQATASEMEGGISNEKRVDEKEADPRKSRKFRSKL